MVFWPSVHWPGPSFSFLQARVTLPSVLACQPPSQAPVGEGERVRASLRERRGQMEEGCREGSCRQTRGLQRGSRMDSIRLKR